MSGIWNVDNLALQRYFLACQKWQKWGRTPIVSNLVIFIILLLGKFFVQVAFQIYASVWNFIVSMCCRDAACEFVPAIKFVFPLLGAMV
ncbi:hypothetical protein LOK49_LG05G03631 [Camellia lanceoleosa]|uniref:Uncharacterized protein n=1 Tax=Camellia lanceoleosa TaxID=1840588 RepID=A0ACC0HJK7_9ERIC|nr:hypothetical protein LOK49_LG05G03631 [Camellia lanceoleosa]